MGGGANSTGRGFGPHLEGGRVFTQQHGDGVLALGALQPDVGGLGAGCFQLRLRLRDIRQRGAAALVQVLSQLQRGGVVLHRLIEQHLLGSWARSEK